MTTIQDGLKESQVRAILENIQDALIATDPDGVVLYMNDAATHLYGFGERVEAELENLNLQRYALNTFELRTLADAPIPESEQPLTRALRGEAYRDMELLVRHRDLEETQVFVFSGRLVDTDPRISVLTIRDETDRWQAERRYRTVFEADPAPSLVARLDDEQILQANSGLQEMFGDDKSEIIGQTLTDLDVLSDNGDLPTTLEMLRAGERIHKHKTTLRQPATGEPMNVLVSARTIEIDGDACGLFTFTDITELERSQREQLEAQEELVHARSRLAEQRERERARIAQDLHDGVMQDLLALNAEFANKERTFREGGNPDAAEISRLGRERALRAAAELRRTVRGLHPPALQELGLWLALRESLPDHGQPGHPEIVLPRGSGPDLPEETLAVLYRVAREAIQNAVKHANASEVRVTLRTTETDAVLQVQDDGQGFEVPKRLSMLQRDDHFGLLGMEQRITAQGGQLKIEATPGEGTTIRCQIPLTPTDRWGSPGG